MVPQKTIALAGVAVPVLFTALVVAQEVLQPDYNRIRLPISALAAWPLGWVQQMNFLICGLLLIAFAYGLNKGIRPAKDAAHGAAGTALLAMGGIGVIVAGAFSWKFVDGVLTEPAPHVVGAITTFASTGLGFLRLGRRMVDDPRWRDLANYVRLTGGAVLVLFIAVGFFAVSEGTPLHPWAGLLQRVLCVIWFACLIVLALRLRRV